MCCAFVWVCWYPFGWVTWLVACGVLFFLVVVGGGLFGVLWSLVLGATCGLRSVSEACFVLLAVIWVLILWLECCCYCCLLCFGLSVGFLLEVLYTCNSVDAPLDVD